MWEMQRQGRRAGALDADLISNRLGEMTVFVVCSGLRAVGLDGSWMGEYGQYSRAAAVRA